MNLQAIHFYSSFFGFKSIYKKKENKLDQPQYNLTMYYPRENKPPNMRANKTISNWKSPDREERKYHMYDKY